MIINTSGNITSNKITSSSLDSGDIRVSGSTIGHSSDTDLNTFNRKIEVNGTLETNALIIDSTAIAATGTEINKLSGLTVNASKLNLIENVTSDIQGQIDTKLSSAIAGSTYAPITGKNTIVTVGNLTAGSIGGNMEINTTNNITTTGDITGTALKTSSLVLGSNTVGHVNDTGLITLSNGEVNVAGVLQASTINIGGTNVSALASDINKLTGLNTTSAELEHVHGVTSDIQTQLNSRITTDNANATFSLKAGSNNITTVGALDAGSITSGFGSINIGDDTITTSGTVTGGEFNTENIA